MTFHKKILLNGLRVITAPMKGNPTVTVLVLVEAGTKYETKNINGLSHFLEHMCFKGTERRPKSIQISRELDGLGAQYNAFTSHEYTGYYAKGQAKHFSKFLDIISDIYLHSTFPVPEMEREKGVILDEINMYEDLPTRRVQELFLKLLYGNQPAGWSVLGRKEVIRKITPTDFSDYRKNHYVASGTVVIVAGDIDQGEAFREIKNKFAPISVYEKRRKQKVAEFQKKPAVLVKYKKTDQTHLVLGMRTCGVLDKNIPVLEVLAGILGKGMSSRLFQRIRENMGVGYYVRAGHDAYTDHGFLSISTGVDNKRVLEVIKATLEECRKLKEEKISEKELKKAKDFLIGNMYLGLESSDSLADFFGVQAILRKPIESPAETAQKIKKVSSGDIRRQAGKIFRNDNLNLALIGPFLGKDSFVKIAGF